MPEPIAIPSQRDHVGRATEGLAVHRKLAPIALVVACLLTGCGSTPPTAPPASPAGSPVAQVDASPPVVNNVQAPPSSGEPAPSASAAPQPTPTPDPAWVRTAAAAQFQVAGDANSQAFDNKPGKPVSESDIAQYWGSYAADLRKLQVPADTVTDLHTLIRRVVKLQTWERAAAAARSSDDWYRARRHIRDTTARMADAVDRVRSDLGLPALCRAGCPD